MKSAGHSTSNRAPDNAIMVTGGAGFVGQQVVRRLAEQGRSVVALYHHKLPESLDNIYPVGSDMATAELLAAPLRGVDTVIHLAWEGGLAGPSAEINYDPATPTPLPRNAQILKNLVTAMERSGTRRIVFLSAVGASRHSSVSYLQEKYLCEFLVLNSKIPEKVILRSSVVFGGQPGHDRFVRSIMRVMKYPVYPVPRKEEKIAPVHVQDLATMLVSASKHPVQEPAYLLEVQGGENYAVQDIFRIVSDRCVKRTQLALPRFISSPLLPFFERERNGELHVPKLAHFLALGGQSHKDTEVDNPLVDVIPPKLGSFKEKILD